MNEFFPTMLLDDTYIKDKLSASVFLYRHTASEFANLNASAFSSFTRYCE